MWIQEKKWQVLHNLEKETGNNTYLETLYTIYMLLSLTFIQAKKRNYYPHVLNFKKILRI